MYLCKFDSVGKRISTVVSGIHFNTDEEKQAYLDDGYIETSAEDYAYYVGNKGNGANGMGYIRGTDGKPTDAPAYEPTTEEKLAQLDSDYQSQKQELISQYTDDMLHGDTEAMESDKQAMTELDAWYDEEYTKIEGSEEE